MELKEKIHRSDFFDRNPRINDWVHLVDLNSESTALVIGRNGSNLARVLSNICREVNCAEDYDSTFPIGHFDLISVHASREASSFQAICRQLRGCLKEGGALHLIIGNKLLPKKLSELFLNHTFWGYKSILRKEGFSDIQFYAPLPNYRGAPMFYVPLEDRHIINYFFKSIFPLFETVSPQKKRQYLLMYPIAKLATRFILAFRLSFMLKFFVPGYCVIAKK